MSINIQRAQGQLNRFTPTEDAVICLITSGSAVGGKIALSEPKQIFSINALEELGITADNNPVAHRDVTDFYAKTGDGAELNIMLVSDATSLTDIVDPTKDIAKKLLEFTAGRGVLLLVNRKAPVGYSATITNGIDADVMTAATKLNDLAVQYQNENLPFVGVLPALGFDSTKIAEMANRSTLALDNVAVNAACEKADGHASQGVLAAWMALRQVNQNVGGIAFGKVVDTAFFPDGVAVDKLRASWKAIDDKGIVFFYKETGKSGYFYYDDPTLTSLSSDYSSISWNRIINKAHRITQSVLVEKLKADVDLNPTTGLIESSLLSDWESDVENAVTGQMVQVGVNKQREISGIRCAIDPSSDIVNGVVNATLDIVRNGQVKQFNVKIGYVKTINN